MLTSIDKALVGLILAAVAGLTDLGGDNTIAQGVEALVVALGVWAFPNKG